MPDYYCWFNGRLVRLGRAKVSLMTHALHYGTAVFEGIRAYATPAGLSVFRLPEHLARLANSARMILLKLPYNQKQLAEAVLSVLRKNNFRSDCYIRPLAFAGSGGMDPSHLKSPVDVAIIAVPFPRLYRKPGLKVSISSWRRISDSSNPVLGKISGNYVNTALARAEAFAQGYDGTILLDQKGLASEGSGENLMIVRSKSVITPSLSSSILEGITRDSIVRIARDEHIPVEEREVSRGELYACDEAFFTGTAAEVTPIVEIDGRTVGNGKPGPITLRLKTLFEDAVRRKLDRYKSWITPV